MERDESRLVLDATARVLKEMLSANAIDASEVVSIFFTMTPDLRSAFPAEAAREVGLTDTALLCAREIDVPGSVARVVRILVHFNTDGRGVGRQGRLSGGREGPPAGPCLRRRPGPSPWSGPG